MAKKFLEKEVYLKKLDEVYRFHQRCYETILDYLKEHGDIKISEEEQHDWRFMFLDFDGTFDVRSISLKENGLDLYLDCFETNTGDSYEMDWIDINHDMVIVEMMMEKVFELQGKC